MLATFPKSYVVWDLETDGFDKVNGHIIEVAVVTVSEGKVVGEWSALIDNDVDIPEGATAVHGITREMCKEKGEKPEVVLAKIHEILKLAQAHITHNGTKFDIPFLYNVLKRAGIDANIENIESCHIDTAALYKASKMNVQKNENETWHAFFSYVLEQRVPGLKYNVGVCCDDLGISREGVQQHRALADVLLTNEIYQKLIG